MKILSVVFILCFGCCSPNNDKANNTDIVKYVGKVKSIQPPMGWNNPMTIETDSGFFQSYSIGGGINKNAPAYLIQRGHGTYLQIDGNELYIGWR